MRSRGQQGGWSRDEEERIPGFEGKHEDPGFEAEGKSGERSSDMYGAAE